MVLPITSSSYCYFKHVFKTLVRRQRQSVFFLKLSGINFSSACTASNSSKMDVLTLTALSDNYMYLLVDRASKTCAAVDPVEPSKILDAVKEHGFQLSSVLTTHHHSDHAGGNADLVKKWKALTGKDLPVYGGDKRIDAITHTVKNGDKLKVGNNLCVHCLATPCHTTGHICYHVTDETNSREGVVFTGDTLFLGGCGRFFEGTAEEMYRSLIECLAKLPADTAVYCGHEYTVKNLEFAMTVEPNNQTLQNRLTHARKTRESGHPTVPGSIAEELATNPFMRVCEQSVQTHANTTNPVEAMRVIRQEKDHF